MRRFRNLFIRFPLLPLTAFLSATLGIAQTNSSGTVKGSVTLEDSGKPVHGVNVTLAELKQSTVTADDGSYSFANIAPGIYTVIAHLDRVPDVVDTVVVEPGTTVTVDLRLRLRAAGEQVTVTATGYEQSTLDSVSSVTTVDSATLVEKNTASLGEALDNQLGIAKRTFGPGTSRPVVRGFDGNRVVVLQDGNQIGALGFQSGDHAEPIDVLNLDKLEVVKGPATLLYGSNAIGGVVNAITGHESSHPGLRGYVNGVGSTNSYQAGGGGGVEYGVNNWLVWGNGGGQRAGDYDTPIGRITNSYARDGNGSGGFGYFGNRGFLNFDYGFNKRRYGIPFDPEEEDPEIVFLNPRRHSIHAETGFRGAQSAVAGGKFSVQYNDYRHSEVNAESLEVNTTFSNKTVDFRGVFEQRGSERFSGSFGFSGLHRDYSSAGEEALAPPTRQNAFALFTLQKLDLALASLQFGGRFEHNGYSPDSVPGRSLPSRSFDGFSGAFGVRFSLGPSTAFATNFSHSYRAATVEELYNNGPHPGNATFEIGDPDLKRETSNGIDLSLRHSSGRLRSELNYFYYHMTDFIFLAPTGGIEDGLIEAEYTQGASRYTGAEARFEAALHPNLWLLSRVDYVNAKLTDTGTPLPRIPPLRGTVGIEVNLKNLRLNPEVVMIRDQTKLFPIETRTSGASVFNFSASYTLTQEHAAHILSLTAFNLGDRLYRNHLSFIKDFAPEIGRGIRLSYTMKFF